jgi:hypothetical protein
MALAAASFLQPAPERVGADRRTGVHIPVPWRQAHHHRVRCLLRAGVDAPDVPHFYLVLADQPEQLRRQEREQDPGLAPARSPGPAGQPADPGGGRVARHGTADENSGNTSSAATATMAPSCRAARSKPCRGTSNRRSPSEIASD